MELFVSEAEVEDADMLIDYFNQVGGESDYLTYGLNECKMNVLSEMELIEEMHQQEQSCLLLGFIDDELVSVASLIGETQKRMSHTCELGISVKKDYWHMSIGSSMMEELILYAREHHIDVIYLEVRSDNMSAMGLYKKFGFIETGKMPKRFKIDDHYYDATTMALTL